MEPATVMTASIPFHLIATPAAPAAIGPYSQGTQLGNLMFASGQLPMLADGTLVAGGIEAQTRQALANLAQVLQAGGAGLDSVLKTTVFVKDLNDFAQVNAVYAECFGSHRPARSTVEVARLPKDALVEIEAIACSRSL
jgi:2-iminobutanoate/2-iminopropanoate deaminase